LPGVASASEILLGLELGLQRFKLFPASVAGGPEALRAFYGPFPDVRFCPTGGIDRASVAAYLQLPNVDCVGATWVVPDTMVAAADWAGIGANARFVAQLRSVQP
jgi:2-dehydro-3-deoxyphosphogluconate aldolase/(4S)-4-hydroxy-2-oxoglutarate aldolase